MQCDGCARQLQKDVQEGLPPQHQTRRSANALRTTGWASDDPGAYRSRGAVFLKRCVRRKRPSCWSLGEEFRRGTTAQVAATLSMTGGSWRRPAVKGKLL